MSNIPTQIRAVDPYSSYHSNFVNKLTRTVTKGEDLILGKDSVELSISNNTELALSSGYVIKDDVLIYVNSEFLIDVTSSDFYLAGTTPFNVEGIYYIVLDYLYQKTKPAPQSKIIILKPSEQSRITEDRFLFLGAMNVINSGGSLIVDEVYKYDPDDTTVTRKYDFATTLDDEIIKNLELYGIFIDEDRELRYEGQNIDTRVEFDTTVGDVELVYKSPVDGLYYQAIADGSIRQNGVGVSDIVNNRVVFTGLIETDLTYSTGTNLYLSDLYPGEFTDQETPLGIAKVVDINGLILLNVGIKSEPIGDPYMTQLYLSSNRTFTIRSNYGCIVPERYIIEDDAELIIEDDAVFMVV